MVNFGAASRRATKGQIGLSVATVVVVRPVRCNRFRSPPFVCSGEQDYKGARLPARSFLWHAAGFFILTLEIVLEEGAPSGVPATVARPTQGLRQLLRAKQVSYSVLNFIYIRTESWINTPLPSIFNPLECERTSLVSPVYPPALI